MTLAWYQNPDCACCLMDAPDADCPCHPRLESMGRHQVVVVDPPWTTGGNMTHKYLTGTGKQDLPYETMTLSEIAAVPIPEVLLPDAWVFLWTTSRFLPDAFDLIKTWGLEYCFTMTWHKGNGPKPSQGPKYVGEFIVVGRQGNPEFTTTRNFFSVNSWSLMAHSAKPWEFYTLLTRITTGPRLDVFNRRRIPGFAGWGWEAPTNVRQPDEYQGDLL